MILATGKGSKSHYTCDRCSAEFLTKLCTYDNGEDELYCIFCQILNKKQTSKLTLEEILIKKQEIKERLKGNKMNNKTYAQLVNEGKFPEEIQVPIDPSFNDDRGSITNMWLGNSGSTTLITSKKGSSRASHYHTGGDFHVSYIISGSIKYIESDIDGSNRKEYMFKAGESFISKSMKWHRMDFIEDTVFVTMNGISKDHIGYESNVVRKEF